MSNTIIKSSYKKYIIYLFFDLFDITQNIRTIIQPKDIIILIGDTPSYISFFLKHYNIKFHHLAMSNKAFGCFTPPYAELLSSHKYDQIYSPELKHLKSYFKYLNNKTELTKKYIKRNWNNLILIDSSSGQSIHGVSMFFNLYVSNIKIKTREINKKIIVDCHVIKNAKPLQFINIMARIKNFNLDPINAKQIISISNENYGINFDPRLIISIGSFDFLLGDLFKIDELFPRIVPTYSINKWIDSEPILNYNNKQIIEIQNIFEFLLNINDSIKNKKISKIKKDVFVNNMKQVLKYNKNLIKYVSSDVKQTMHNLKSILMTKKYDLS